MPLHIIGTSHIASQSVDEIKAAFDSFHPDLVAVELDSHRASALLSGTTRTASPLSALKFGLTGYLFALLAQSAQRRLGHMVGIEPGSEMKTALLLAQNRNCQTALIDQPLPITLKNISRSFGWREKLRFLSDIFQALLRPTAQARKLGLDFDLRKVPESQLISKMIALLQTRYPSLYKALIDDRNRYMAKKLVQLLRKHPGKKILVIVGAGHLAGIHELLLKVDIF